VLMWPGYVMALAGVSTLTYSIIMRFYEGND